MIWGIRNVSILMAFIEIVNKEIIIINVILFLIITNIDIMRMTANYTFLSNNTLTIFKCTHTESSEPIV